MSQRNGAAAHSGRLGGRIVSRYTLRQTFREFSARAAISFKELGYGVRGKRRSLETAGRRPRVIVSMTSIPSRLDTLPLVIKSILWQTEPPDKIVLWLSEQHERKELGNLAPSDIPPSLRKLERRGLEICWTEDIGAYRKLLPSLRRFPEDIIITMDDDICHDKRAVELLCRAYREHGGRYFYSMKSHVIKWDGDHGEYRIDRGAGFSAGAEPYRLIIGNSGVLYPPGTFTEEVFNRKAFTELAKYDDDCWYTLMATLNGKRAFHAAKARSVHLRSRFRDRLTELHWSPDGAKFHQRLNEIARRYGLELR